MLLAPKLVPQVPSPSESRKGFTLGSASLVIGDSVGELGVNGYEQLPEWVKAGEEPDPSLRDWEEEKAYGESNAKSVPAGEMLDRAVGSGKAVVGRSMNVNGDGSEGEGKGKEKAKTLDDWLAEEESEEEVSDDEESEEEGSEEEDDEESEEETDDEEDEESEEESDDGAEGDQLIRHDVGNR